MSRLPVAVIGAGHLGRIHAKLFPQVEGVDLVAVVDPSEAARESVATSVGCAALSEYQALLGHVEAVIIATPTDCHYEVARDFLEAGAHVFVEKPITSTLAEADSLLAAAERNQRVFQVGHIERFNPAFTAALPYATGAKYIEAIRASSYTFRSTDIGVVLDLMIHDIDLVLSLTRSPVVDVQALGIAIFGPHEDMAQARITFANGCVANLTASRTSFTAQRSMNTYGPNGFAAINFAERSAEAIQPAEWLMQRAVPVEVIEPAERTHIMENLFDEVLPKQSLQVAEETNALLEEQRDFIHAIRNECEPRVTGYHGREALAVAQQILSKISSHRWNGSSAPGPMGPLATPSVAPLQGPHWQQSQSPTRKAG